MLDLPEAHIVQTIFPPSTCFLIFYSNQMPDKLLLSTDDPFSSLQLAPAGLALGVGRSSRGEGGLGGDLGDVVEGLAVGFPDGVVGSLGVEETADALVVEKLGAAVDESVLEAGDGDFVGL